ncbi:MAG: hypothetical protein SGPRY_001970, partial [Prymnesium sp.]
LEPGGLASEAGLLVGSLLLSVNGEVCETHAQTVDLIDSLSSLVHLVYRDNLETLSLTRGEGGWGFTVVDGREGLGVVVDAVNEGGAAAASLSVGDELLAIDGTLVRDVPKVGQP